MQRSNNSLRKSLLAYASILTLTLVASHQPVFAQNLIVNGGSATASGAYNSGIATGTAGYGFNVSNSGSVTSNGPISILTGGSSAYGISITGSGSVNLSDDVTITTGGSNATSIYLSNSSFLTTGILTINPTGPGGGIYAYNNSVVKVSNGGSIAVTGSTYALNIATNSSFEGRNLAITSTGTISAVMAGTGSVINLDGGSISGWGNGNTVTASGAGSKLLLSNLSVTTLNLSAGTPSTPAGVSVSSGGRFEVDNAVITTYTDSGEGVIAHTSATGIVRNSIITTYGSNAIPGDAGAGSTGARSGIGSRVEVYDTVITTYGAGSSGIETDDGGELVMTGGSVTTYNADAQGILSTATAAGSPSGQITVTNVPIVATGDGIGVYGGEANITLIGSSLTTGSNTALNVRANPNATGGSLASVAVVSAHSSTITGAMITEAGSSSDVALRSGSMWNLTGNSNLTNLVNDSSTIDISAPNVGVFKTLTTNAYTGANGIIAFNTHLGGDGSPSDLLIIDGGTATGRTSVIIKNAAGAGAQTGNGILLVDARNGATTETTAFALSNRAAAGAYEYLLYCGGNAEAGGDPNDQNWYLRSTLQVTDPDPIDVPNYRVEVPLVASITPIALEYGYAMLDTLHERVGEVWTAPVTPSYEERVVRENNGRKQVARAPLPRSDKIRWASSAWGRVIGDRGFRDNDNFERRGPDYDYTFAAIQAGLDIYAREQADGTLDKAGIYVGYGQIDANVKGAWQGKAGSIDMDAYTVGAYWTHKAAQGWYTDAVVQGTWYAADAKSTYGERLKPDGFGFVASLEGGYAFDLGNGFAIEPQAQLAYQNVSFDDVVDTYGRFKLADGESLRGRLGVRLSKVWNAGDVSKPRLISTWLRANVWHEFMGDPSTTVTGLTGENPVMITSSLSGTWAEIGAGISGQVSESVALFATGAYNRSIDNKGRKAWDGRLGVTVKW